MRNAMAVKMLTEGKETVLMWGVHSNEGKYNMDMWSVCFCL